MTTTTFTRSAAVETPTIKLGPILRFLAIVGSSYSWAQSVRRVYARSGSAMFADYQKAGL